MENNQVNKLQCRVCVLPDVATLPDHEAMEESLTIRTMNAARVRAAILDVIDEMDLYDNGSYVRFRDGATEREREAFVDDARLDFASRVQQRIEELEKVGLP